MIDPVFTTTVSADIFAGAISPSYDLYAIGTVYGETILHSKALSNPLSLQYCSGSVRSLEYGEGNDILLSADSGGGLYVTDLASNRNTFSLKKAHNTQMECAKFLTTSTVVSGDTAGRLKVWDLRTGKTVRVYSPEDDYVSDICVIDSRSFVATHGNGVTSVFSLTSNKRKQYYKQEDDDFVSVTYSPFMQYVLIASSKPRIYVAKYPSLDFVCEAPGVTKSPIVTLRMLPGTQCRVAMAHEDGCVCISDIAPNRPVYAFRAHKNTLMRSAVMTGSRMMTWDSDRTVHIWDLEEISHREVEKDKSKKKRGKNGKKKTSIRITEKGDDFFSNY